MKTNLRLALLTLLAVLAIPVMSAFADTRQGFYVAVNTGGSHRVDHVWGSRTLNYVTEFNNAPFVDMEIGYKYRNFRGELEGLWERIDLAASTPVSVNEAGLASYLANLPPTVPPPARAGIAGGIRSAVGQTRSLSGTFLARGLMVNGWYDIDFWGSRWVPYVGGGFGVVDGEWSDLAFGPVIRGAPPAGSGSTAPQRSPATTNPNEEDTAFAWRVGGGVSYQLADNIFVQVLYRFNRSSELGRTGTRLKYHNYGGGIRYFF